MSDLNLPTEHAMSEQALSDRTDSHLSPKGLLRLIEGNVTADARRRAFDHMRRCDGCARQFENAVMAERLLGSDDDAADVPLPELDTLLPAILDETVPQKKRFSSWLVALPALAMAAGVLFAVNLSDGPSAPSEGDIVIQPITDGVGTGDTGEFKTRGNGEDAAAKAAKGSIDLVCITNGKPTELKEGGVCAEGSELYVAVKPAPLKGAVRLRVLDFTNKPVALIFADVPGQTFPVADFTVPLTQQTEGMADVMIKVDAAAAKAGKITVYAEVCDDCAVADLAKPAASTDTLARRHHKASVTVASAAQGGR